MQRRATTWATALGAMMVVGLIGLMFAPDSAHAGRILAQGTFQRDCATGETTLTNQQGDLTLVGTPGTLLPTQPPNGVTQPSANTMLAAFAYETVFGPHTVTEVACDGNTYATWFNNGGAETTVVVDVSNTGKCNVLIQSGQIRDIAVGPGAKGGSKVKVLDKGFVSIRCTKSDGQTCSFTVVIKERV